MNNGLTSIRALAFFAIFLFHINVYGSGNLGIQGGYLGVEAFFVLSGFLLTPILVEMKSNLNRKDFFIHFYGRRALRIFPLYYAYIVLVASMSYLTISHYGYSAIAPTKGTLIISQMNRFIEQLPWTATYTYDFFHASIYAKNSLFASHFWSLAVEEQFYLVWPLAILFVPTNHLKRFLLFIIVFGPLIRTFLAVITDAHMIPGLRQTDRAIYALPFSYVDAFAAGGYFALYGKSSSSYWVWLSIVFVFMLGVITSWLWTGQIHLGDLGYGPFMRDSYKIAWGYSVVNLMFAYILIHVRNKSFMPILFENPLLVYLGTISYGLYVFHIPVILLVHSTMYDFPELVQDLAILLITVIISMISYEYMEKRFINSKDKYFARASAAK